MDEGRLLQKLLKAGDRERTASQKKQAAELNRAEKRKAELDRLFAKMYEDWAAGRITEYNFNMPVPAVSDRAAGAGGKD